MSFGLRNAPATFQRLMNLVTAGLVGCAVYLDDVVVFSDTWVDHIQRIAALFSRLAGAHLTVNLAKCEFAKATVTYLGRVVGQGQVRPVDAKVRAICLLLKRSSCDFWAWWVTIAPSVEIFLQWWHR